MAVIGCLLLVAGLFSLDQHFKDQMEKKDAPGGTRKRCKGFLLVRKSHNAGGMMRLGEKKRTVVTVLSVIWTLAVLLLFAISLGNWGNRPLRLGLSLLLGGAFSNTYDRLKRKYVVDYFSFAVPWEGLRKVVFNLADFGILIGALIAALSYPRN